MLALKHITSSTEELDTVRDLFKAYGAELDADLCFQSFEEELQDPLKKYGPPSGSLILAYWNKEPIGCIALQPLKENGVCEMKRLFVRPAFRKHKIGDALVMELLKHAKRIGYTKMKLDTLERLQAAIHLYKQHGFVVTAAYYENPLDEVVYMEKAI